jgi:sigma-B regulation protein RsbU (phosphoserine phosphatase)
MPDRKARKTVLAVDDTPENLDVVKGILASDYTVKVATNGHMALKIAETQAPDLILLDIMMPEMDGFEVCRRLKAESGTRDIPVIFLTAMDQTTDEAAGFEVGAADYITKPINPPILEARVRTHLALKESMDALQDAYRIIKGQKDRMEAELNVGRDIQLGMLPTYEPDRDEFSVAATMQAAREVGGDFYDYFPVGPQKYAFCVADVSDKGVASALFMSVTKAMMKSRCREDSSTASVATWVNDEIAADNDSCMFITLFIGILDTRTGTLRYTNAGHNPPYVKRADGSVECIDARHGPVLGAVEGLAYGEDTLQMSRGDAMLLFTDGVTEAMNNGRELFGEARLEEFLASAEENEVNGLVNGVLSAVRSFADGAAQSDDITLLSFTYDTAPETEAAHRLDIRIPNKQEAIADATDRFRTFAEEHGVPTQDVMRVNLVFDEILSNIISYAYQDDAGHEIKIGIDLTAEKLLVSIEDDGIPFNPFAREEPDTSLSIEDREIGGLGIHLVKNVMDEVTYHRRQDANLLVLSKNLA